MEAEEPSDVLNEEATLHHLRCLKVDCVLLESVIQEEATLLRCDGSMHNIILQHDKIYHSGGIESV